MALEADRLRFRRGGPPDSEALTQLAFASKAAWGYSTEFLNQHKDDLRVKAAYLEKASVFVAEQVGQPVGFVGLSELGKPPELEFLFVTPEVIGQGIGTILWNLALVEAVRLGWQTLTIVADPHAEPFYIAKGARRIGKHKSTIIPGRELPILEAEVDTQRRVFVYGALMSEADPKSRGQAAYVHDHAIRFIVKGVWPLEPAFAALVKAKEGFAWGVVLNLNEDEWRQYSRHEISYEEQTVVAWSKKGEALPCTALVLNKKALSEEKTPSARYARILLKSAKKHGFPTEVIAHYDALAKRGSRISAYFNFLVPLIKRMLPYTGPHLALILTYGGFLAILAMLTWCLWHINGN